MHEGMQVVVSLKYTDPAESERLLAGLGMVQ